MCLSYCVVPCLDQNTGVNVSELLCIPSLDQNTVVNVSELLCGTMSRPEYGC